MDLGDTRSRGDHGSLHQLKDLCTNSHLVSLGHVQDVLWSTAQRRGRAPSTSSTAVEKLQLHNEPPGSFASRKMQDGHIDIGAGSSNSAASRSPRAARNRTRVVPDRRGKKEGCGVFFAGFCEENAHVTSIAPLCFLTRFAL